MNKFSLKIILTLAFFLLLVSNHLGAVDELNVKKIGANQESSLILNHKCNPIVTKKLRPESSGLFNFVPVDEAMFRKKAVELNANTFQEIYSHVMTQDTRTAILYAYVRFWNCP
jgi:hypothetical protein